MMRAPRRAKAAFPNEEWDAAGVRRIDFLCCYFPLHAAIYCRTQWSISILGASRCFSLPF